MILIKALRFTALDFKILKPRACVRNPSEAIASRLREMSEVFLQSYEAKGDEDGGLARGFKLQHVTTISQYLTLGLVHCSVTNTPITIYIYIYLADIAVKYFCLAEAMYYKTLEGIIDQEKRRLGDSDLSVRFFHLFI